MTTQLIERPEQGVTATPTASPKANAKAESKTDAKASTQVLVVRSASELEQFVAAWEDLAASACEPNVFYEPWMLLPAIKAFGAGHDFEFTLVFAVGKGPESAKPVLNGIFPMERHKRYKGLPVAALTLWKHLYSMLCTPLVRQGQEGETLHALLDYFASAPDAPGLLDWIYLSGEGPFHQALVEVLHQRKTVTHIDETWIRALLRVKADSSGDDYLRAALSSKRRKEFKRQESRLGEAGDLQFVALEPYNASDDEDGFAALNAYLADFIQIEASGWKGQEGSAFACNPEHQEFFFAVTKEAYKRKRLRMLALQLDGRSIAAKCDFLAGDGSFAFKIAYNEEYSRFSPGVLVEIECLTRLHDKHILSWVDSCAVPDHPMINRLWTERRTLQNLVIATGQGRGEFFLSVLPLLRWLKGSVRRKKVSKTQSTPQISEEKESS